MVVTVTSETIHFHVVNLKVIIIKTKTYRALAYSMIDDKALLWNNNG